MSVKTRTSTPAAEDAGEEHAAQRKELQDENAQLQQAVRSHAVVDQAIGVVIVLGRLTPEQGWDVLRKTSQRTNTKLRTVSELIVQWARTGQLPTDISKELDQQLAHVQHPHRQE
ncbi:ANTAR domain-containing protein [Streptomyces sp. NPDC088747]|uniref:ANTAR domain-containing protein n=1 Tax=Streptomyces sp. NPDC088747 TaxID=3365886 RepID=UPI0038142BBD